MSKKTVRKLVHLNQNQIQIDKNAFEKLLTLKNKQLNVMVQIKPDFHPSGIDLIQGFSEYVKNEQKFNPRISIENAANILGYEIEYRNMLELEQSISSSALSRFGKYINYSSGSFIAADEFLEDLTEQNSIYLTNKKAIDIHSKTEKFIKLWDELVDESWLNDKQNLSWRLSNSFQLVRVSPEKGTILEPNYIQIANYMEE